LIKLNFKLLNYFEMTFYKIMIDYAKCILIGLYSI